MRFLFRSLACALGTMIATQAYATVIDETVGPSGEFQTISSAVTAADQDTNSADYFNIEITPGIYTNDFPLVTRSMTIELAPGDVGSVILDATMDLPNEKGIILVNGDSNLTVNGLTFEGAQISDDLGGNGAGIRDQNSGPDAGLTVENSVFTDNQTGILQGDDFRENISVLDSEFINNGNPDFVDPNNPAIPVFQHALYVNDAASLLIDNSLFCGQLIGHDVKSRALATTVENSQLFDGAADPNNPACTAGSTSFAIDAPNGGIVGISNNDIVQGQNTQNDTMVTYGEEGILYGQNSLDVTDNTFTNTASDAIGVADPNCIPAHLSGNIFNNVPTPFSPAQCVAATTVPEPSSLVLELSMIGLLLAGLRLCRHRPRLAVITASARAKMLGSAHSEPFSEDYTQEII